jgi:hypothetical protein
MSTEGLTDGNSILRRKFTLSVTPCCGAHATSHNLTAKEKYTVCMYVRTFNRSASQDMSRL